MSVSSFADPSTSPILTAMTALGTALEGGDADAIAELLAPDAVFHSPFTNRMLFEGKDQVAAIHRDSFDFLEDIHTTEPLTNGDTGSLTFYARVRGVELEGVTLARFNKQGQIVDLKLFTRLLPGLATLFAVLPPQVSTRRHGRLRGMIIALPAMLLARPLAFGHRIADLILPRFI
jgi:ketosteroid isomerase-like protein